MVTAMAKMSCKELPRTLKALPRTADPSQRLHRQGGPYRPGGGQLAGSLLAHRSERAMGHSPRLRARTRPVEMVTAMAKMSDRGHGQDPQQHTNGLNRSPSLCTPSREHGAQPLLLS